MITPETVEEQRRQRAEAQAEVNAETFKRWEKAIDQILSSSTRYPVQIAVKDAPLDFSAAISSMIKDAYEKAGWKVTLYSSRSRGGRGPMLEIEPQR